MDPKPDPTCPRREDSPHSPIDNSVISTRAVENRASARHATDRIQESRTQSFAENEEGANPQSNGSLDWNTRGRSRALASRAERLVNELASLDLEADERRTRAVIAAYSYGFGDPRQTQMQYPFPHYSSTAANDTNTCGQTITITATPTPSPNPRARLTAQDYNRLQVILDRVEAHISSLHHPTLSARAPIRGIVRNPLSNPRRRNVISSSRPLEPAGRRLIDGREVFARRARSPSLSPEQPRRLGTRDRRGCGESDESGYGSGELSGS